MNEVSAAAAAITRAITGATIGLIAETSWPRACGTA